MATKTTDKTSETKLEPPVYTAKAIGAALGFDASGIEKYYYPEACTLHQVDISVLKSGHLFTQFFYDLVFLFRQHRMRERCVLNEAGLIVRHEPTNGEIGKPVLRKNEKRQTAAQFREWYWDSYPELIPLVAIDSPETIEVAICPSEIVLYSAPVYEEVVGSSIDGTLLKVELLENSMQTWREAMTLQARNQGKAIAGEMISEMQSEISSTMNDFFTAAQKATRTT